MIVTASSNDIVKIPNGNLTLNDLGGGNWTIAATGALDQVDGPVTITVTVDDGAVTTDEVFDVTINSLNDAPVLSIGQNLNFDEIADYQKSAAEGARIAAVEIQEVRTGS